MEFVKSSHVLAMMYQLLWITGTRMWRRGADMDGNTANFVETEQLLETEGYVASYTQVPSFTLYQILMKSGYSSLNIDNQGN